MTEYNRAAVSSLPTVDVFNGNGITMEIAEPRWLYAGRITELEDDGLSWWFVYRSTALRMSLHQRLFHLLDGASLIGAEVVADPDMIFGQAELALYGVAA